MSLKSHPWPCNVCFKVFKTLQELENHLETVNCSKKGICPICKKFKILEPHHWSYKDYEEDPPKNTILLCNNCHGAQQIVRKQIRLGNAQIYIKI